MKDTLLVLVFVIAIKLILGIQINKPVTKDVTIKDVAKTEIIVAKFDMFKAMLTLPLALTDNSNLSLIMPINKVLHMATEPEAGQVLTNNLTINPYYNAESRSCISFFPRTEVYSDS